MKKRAMWPLCIAVGLFPLGALGHAHLLRTAPAMGEQLAAAPKELTLQFNEAVHIGAVKLSAGDKDIPLPLDHTMAAGPVVTVPLPALAPGAYRVQWSALTVDDGHVVKGTFSFVVAGTY